MTNILGDPPKNEPILGPLPKLDSIFSPETKPAEQPATPAEQTPTPAVAARGLPDIVQRLHGAARIFLTAAVFVSLVIFDPRTIDVFNLAKLTVLWVLGAIAAGLWVTATLLDWKDRERPESLLPRSWIVRLSLALLAITAVATVLSSSPALSFFGLYRRFEGSISIALYIGLFMLVVGLFRHRPSALRDVVSAVAVAAVVVAGYVVLQSLGVDFEDWQQVTGSRPDLPIGNFGNPGLTGSFLGISLPFIVYLVSSPMAFARRVVWTFAGVLVVAGLMLTQSRPGVVGGVVGVLAILLFAAKAHPREQVAVVAAVLFALAVIPLFAPGFLGPRAPSRLTVVAGASEDNRVHMWDAGWRMTLERPVLGWGPETYFGNYPKFRSAVEAREEGLTITDKPHNIFLGWSTSTGFAGLLTFLALIGTALWILGSRGRRLEQPYRGLALTFGGGLCAYLAQGLYSIDVPTLALLGWICLGGLAVLLESKAAQGEPRARETQRGDVLTYCAVGVGVIVLIVVGTRPLRADHSAWAAERKASQGWSIDTMRLYEKAASLHPLEAAYKGLGAFYLERVAGIRTAPFRTEDALRRAATLYEDALAIQPDNVYFMINASRVYARLESFDAADRWLGKALTIDPLDPQLHDLYADLLRSWARNAPRSERRDLIERAETQAEIAKALRAGREIR